MAFSRLYSVFSTLVFIYFEDYLETHTPLLHQLPEPQLVPWTFIHLFILSCFIHDLNNLGTFKDIDPEGRLNMISRCYIDP